MKNQMRFKRLAIPMILIVLLLLALPFVFEGKEYGHLSLSVVDAYSLMPIKNAAVLLPEFKMREYTDENGNAVFFNVPCVLNRSLEKIMPAGFGQTTVLCYGEGYRPYALFYAEIQKDRVREGLTLYLFPKSESSGCLVESPPEKWVNELLRLYEP